MNTDRRERCPLSGFSVHTVPGVQLPLLSFLLAVSHLCSQHVRLCHRFSLRLKRCWALKKSQRWSVGKIEPTAHAPAAWKDAAKMKEMINL